MKAATRSRIAESPGAAGPLLTSLTSETMTQDWRLKALCAEVAPELFFPRGDGFGAMDVVEAKKVCRQCPVRDECLKDALESGADHGVWGGHSQLELRAIRKEAGLSTDPGPWWPEPVVPTTKKCTGPCGQWLALSEFYGENATSFGHRAKCGACRREPRKAAA
jgi:WhiB family redox-sensing transcriptional regulator